MEKTIFLTCVLFAYFDLFTLSVHSLVVNDLVIPVCPTNITLSNFSLSSGNGFPTYDTKVELCQQQSSTPNVYDLFVKFDMFDENPSSPYTKCNQPLYEYDSVEMFIAAYNPNDNENMYPTTYFEFEMNPNGALFASLITNTCDDCSCITGVLQSCTNTNDIPYYQAQIYDNNSWSAVLVVSVQWITENTYPNATNIEETHLRANFYRIDVLNNGEEYEYSSWNPTYKDPPCFHVPSSFGYFSLS
ncbi:hypothetical protein RFI_13727 [Reticulomyxa filosa]|uniref:Carbohydrate-binding domain-containing protein n=1 Tax=Reticulomyxa filosa TaxID=46433 RepID=X6NCH6_RETFI|nr:hypothetical protein RFI_13727 [Reticulomyxa filosa]|eukprot:ETO23459.1 hypothetical protein RFI_13727 [Reticulomyxa filosa]